MKNNKDNIRCFKFFGKFAWQNDKKYYAFLILNIIVNSLSPFVTILGTQYLIDELQMNLREICFGLCFGQLLFVLEVLFVQTLRSGQEKTYQELAKSLTEYLKPIYV